MRPDPGYSQASRIATRSPVLARVLTACPILPQSAIMPQTSLRWRMKISLLIVLLSEPGAKVVPRELAARIDGMTLLDPQIAILIRISIGVVSAMPLFTSNLPQMLMTLLMRCLILRIQRNRDTSRRIMQCIHHTQGIRPHI